MAKTTPTTRERVLETCRTLFNERGPGAVTTAEIAATVGINEGNLYYYFKKKEQIVLALFDQLEQALGDLSRRQRESEEGGKSDQGNVMDFFKLAWEWRFFYRDLGSLYEVAPGLRARNQRLAETSHESLRRRLQRLADQGRLVAPPEVLDKLVVNTWIVATFWLEYLQVTRGLTRVTHRHLQAGYDQVQSLYAPYLPEGAARPTSG